MSSTSIFPVGAVIASGANLSGGDDWLPCDGRELPKLQYPELYDVLRDNYGGGPTTFRLPDYRGAFLRGTAHGQSADPDASRRTGAPGVRGGDRTGTIQEFATQAPGNAFQASVAHLPSTKWTTHGGTSTHFASETGAAARQLVNGGGDAETRPINVYVNHYIRTRV